MNEKLKQLEDEFISKIEDLEKELAKAEENLKNKLEGNLNNIIRFGLAKDAEEITVLHSQLNVLYEMQSKFTKMFKSELGIED